MEEEQMQAELEEQFGEDLQRFLTSVLRSQSKRKREPEEVPNNMLPPVPSDLVPTTLKELIRLAHICKKTALYRDCQKLGYLVEPLEALDALIGLESIKQHVMKFVVARLQPDVHVPSMAHIGITGPPGTGKTTVANIIAHIMAVVYNASHPRIVHFRADNAIGQYLGQTAPKVRELVRSAFGGVLLIDEVTSLSDGRSSSSGDAFSKVAIDTLNRMLSEDGHLFTCIIAGYNNDIERDFFAVNKGLKRRFGSTWVIAPYTAQEMLTIANQYLQTSKFQLEEPLKEDIFRLKLFPDNAGSVIAFMDSVIAIHAMSVFGQAEKHVIRPCSVVNAIEALKKRELKEESVPYAMYN